MHGRFVGCIQKLNTICASVVMTLIPVVFFPRLMFAAERCEMLLGARKVASRV